MKTDARVCVLFFGLNRSLSLTGDSINRHILEPLKNLNVHVDVYTSFMDPGGAFVNPRSNEINVRAEYETVELLKPKASWLIEQAKFDQSFDAINFSSFRDSWNDHHQSTKNLFRQLYSIQYGFREVLKTGSDYDYFLFFRPDLKYLDKFKFQKYLAHLKASHQDGRVITPGWHSAKGLNDRFALCDRKGAEVYASRYDFASPYMATHDLIHAETFLLKRMKAERIRISMLCDERAVRVRASGQTDHRDLSLEKPMPTDFFGRIGWNLNHQFRMLRTNFR